MKLYKQKLNKVAGYEFRNDFRIFLKCLDLIQDNEITESDKIEAVWDFLFIGGKELPIYEKNEIVSQFFALWSDNKQNSTNEKCFDFVQDAELIYAGFWQAYKIDLFNIDLTIEKFLALLRGLPKGTRFADVIEIRTMPLPKATKYNAEYRNSILKAKKSVSLRTESETNNSNNPFASLGAFVQRLAKK